MALKTIKWSSQLFLANWKQQVQSFSIGIANRSQDMIDMPDNSNITLPIPPYQDKIDEPFKQRKARLLYQSRKRGMLENGLLLSSFAAKYLENMSNEQVQQYDRLINLPTNDWDIYYWAIGRVETPVDFDNEMMSLLKDFVKNKGGESRIRQPDLYSKEPAEDLYRNGLI